MFHARIVRPPSYHCKLIKINEDFKKRLVENEIELFVFEIESIVFETLNFVCRKKLKYISTYMSMIHNPPTQPPYQ